ncbi:MAG: GatB/YqeY domain-containing protein [Patescibacteria group bacterium]
MALKQQIQEDLMTAMKARDVIAMDALRMLKAAMMKLEVSGEKHEATDEEIQQLINKEIKSRKDSIEQFTAGNRQDLADKEEAELKFLLKYLPEQLSEEEVKKIIQDTMDETGFKSKTDMGKLMGALMPKVKGKADGGMVNKLVGSMLS